MARLGWKPRSSDFQGVRGCSRKKSSTSVRGPRVKNPRHPIPKARRGRSGSTIAGHLGTTDIPLESSLSFEPLRPSNWQILSVADFKYIHLSPRPCFKLPVLPPVLPSAHRPQATQSSRKGPYKKNAFMSLFLSCILVQPPTAFPCHSEYGICSL